LPDYPVLMPRRRPRARAAAAPSAPRALPAHARPPRSDVPHPIWQTEGSEVCLFVKDHQGAFPHSTLYSHARPLTRQCALFPQARAPRRPRRALPPTLRAAASRR
jgi:hypothetical protein